MSNIIWFRKTASSVTLVYEPKDGCDWVHKRLDEHGSFNLRNRI